jgi:hypothetical protein
MARDAIEEEILKRQEKWQGQPVEPSQPTDTGGEEEPPPPTRF